VLVATIDGKELARRKLDGPVLKIGRIPSTHFVLDHASVSRVHALVEVTDDVAQIIDLGSVSGTKVNGKRVNKAEIAAGDVLELGDVRVDVIVDEPRG
jgi:pSer/pThr/pTyr-binding forkhead associated (FHA) protein